MGTQTRPDISFAVQWLARQFQGPAIEHLKAAYALLAYLKSYSNLYIKYSAKAKAEFNTAIPVGFADSDYARDSSTSKSTYGYLFTLAGGAISWKSKRGLTIALSTLEAETIALTEATREIQ